MKIRKEIVTVIGALVFTFGLVGCGNNTATTETTPTEDVVEETQVATEDTNTTDVETADAGEEAEVNADDYVFMGGLYISDPENDLTFNMYRTPDGGLVALVSKLGERTFGEFTTEESTLDDGREYVKMTIDGHVYGYHFALENENDDNFLIDEDGTEYFAKEVDVDPAMDYLKEYLGQ